MGRPKGSKNKKDRFADLEDEFKADVQAADDDKIKRMVSEASLNHGALMEAKGKDEDLKEKREVASEAGAVYREGTKRYKLKVEFCRLVLDTRGKPSGEAETA